MLDSPFDLPELRARDRVDCVAGLVWVVRKTQQIADRIKRETKIASVSDENKTVNVGAHVDALVAA